MSVTDVKKIKISQTRGEKNKRQTSVLYRAEVSAATIDPDEALFDSRIPKYGQALVTSRGVDVFQRCKSKSAQRDEEDRETVWVTVEFDTEQASQDDQAGGGDEIENPLHRPADIEVNFTESLEDTYYQIKDDGTHDPDEPIVNSADQLYDPPLQREIFDCQIIIERNEHRGSLPTSVLQEYNGAVNSKKWHSFDAETVKVRIRKRLMRESGFTYWRITYDLRVRDDGWNRKVPDEGYAEATQPSGGEYNYENIIDDQGFPMNQKVLLDGSGNRLNSADRKGDAVLNEFQVDKRKDFGRLNLPDPDRV